MTASAPIAEHRTDASAPSIGHRIDAGYASLSRQEQRAADFILDHLGDLASYTATELAQHSGVSKATVSRLFRRLGFSNSQEVREHARALRSSGVPVGPASAGAPPTRWPRTSRASTRTSAGSRRLSPTGGSRSRSGCSREPARSS